MSSIGPEHHSRFQHALASDRPFQAVYDFASSLRDEGIPQNDLYSFFIEYQAAHRDSDDVIYDAIFDTLNVIHGGPWAKGHDLYPTVLNDKEIEKKRQKSPPIRISKDLI